MIWWLLQTRAGLLTAAALWLGLAGGGVAMDAYTDLDPRAFLVALAATGAVAAAAFAGRQAQLSREYTQLTLRPHLSIERVIRRPGGLGVELRNHGGGLADEIRQSVVFLTGDQDIEAATVTPEWISDTNGFEKVIKKDMGALGGGLTKARVLMQWTTTPIVKPGDVITIATLFEYTTVAEGCKSNSQVLVHRVESPEDDPR